jgi:cleavage and polyadenylation specificity factor subunit 2
MFNFTPLQGVSQYLLELDGGVKVLIGLGWDQSFDPKRLAELEK